MKTSSRQALLLLVLLLATGSAAWWLTLRPEPRLDVQQLAGLPPVLNGWHAVDLEMDQAVARMLRADANLQRAYVHPLGYVVFVYIGYYGTARGGTPEHTPDICYPAQGWRIRGAEEVVLGGRRARLRVREFVVEQEGQMRLVHFWYRTRTSTGITSTWALRWHHFWTRLHADRADGALVRLSTPFEQGELESARSKLQAMDLAVDAALDGVWPLETIHE